MPRLRFRQAVGERDLERILRLNHATFAEEIGQYASTENGLLADRYSTGSRYFLAECADELLGMISVNATPPFSIEKRLPDPRRVLEALRAPCEVRMLAVVHGHRSGLLLAGLLWQTYAEAARQGRSHLLISGVETRLEMYEALGFKALGTGVREGRTMYVPMVLDMADVEFGRKVERFRRWWTRQETEA